MVYEQFKEHPYHRITPREFREELNINQKELNYNIIYLEEKGYLELQKPLEGSLFVGARITHKGIDLVEDEYQFDIIFPDSEPESIRTNVFAQFNLLSDAVESSDCIDNNMKELIIKEIKEIHKELQKCKPSYAVVKKVIVKVKERNIEVGEKLQAILKDPIVNKILAESAKRELDDI